MERLDALERSMNEACRVERMERLAAAAKKENRFSVTIYREFLGRRPQKILAENIGVLCYCRGQVIIEEYQKAFPDWNVKARWYRLGTVADFLVSAHINMNERELEGIRGECLHGSH